LTNIYYNLFLLWALFEILEQPLIKRAFCWNITNSVWLYD